jgi:hypothetical protein
LWVILTHQPHADTVSPGKGSSSSSRSAITVPR